MASILHYSVVFFFVFVVFAGVLTLPRAFFFNDTATTEIYTLSLHDALPISADAGRIADFFVGRPSVLRHPLALASSGLVALRDARSVAESLFETERARGLFAGNAAHSFLPLEQSPSAMFGLLLSTLGHAFGWPFPKGGSQTLADALASYLLSLGGE